MVPRTSVRPYQGERIFCYNKLMEKELNKVTNKALKILAEDDRKYFKLSTHENRGETDPRYPVLWNDNPSKFGAHRRGPTKERY